MERVNTGGKKVRASNGEKTKEQRAAFLIKRNKDEEIALGKY